MQPVQLVEAVYALDMGGSETLARRIAGAIRRTGRYSCFLYAVAHGGPMADVLAAEGIPFRVFSRAGRLDLRLVWRLVRQLREDQVQLVHTHHLGQLLYAGLAGRLAGARVVHTEHESYSFQRPRA